VLPRGALFRGLSCDEHLNQLVGARRARAENQGEAGCCVPLKMATFVSRLLVFTGRRN
jgi:hypothetical protein